MLWWIADWFWFEKYCCFLFQPTSSELLIRLQSFAFANQRSRNGKSSSSMRNLNFNQKTGIKNTKPNRHSSNILIFHQGIKNSIHENLDKKNTFLFSMIFNGAIIYFKTVN